MPSRDLNNTTAPLGSCLSASPSLGQHLSAAAAAGGLLRCPLAAAVAAVQPWLSCHLCSSFWILVTETKDLPVSIDVFSIYADN